MHFPRHPQYLFQSNLVSSSVCVKNLYPQPAGSLHGSQHISADDQDTHRHYAI